MTARDWVGMAVGALVWAYVEWDRVAPVVRKSLPYIGGAIGGPAGAKIGWWVYGRR